MTEKDFWNKIKEQIPLPFEIENVTEVEENCGTVWITCREKTYYLTIEETEE